MTRSAALPPFGREVMSALAGCKAPNVYVFTGADAWERARRRRAAHGKGSAVIAPREPRSRDWRFLRGQAVVLRPTEITTANRAACIALAAELVMAGVPFVAVSDGTDTFAVRAHESDS